MLFFSLLSRDLLLKGVSTTRTTKSASVRKDIDGRMEADTSVGNSVSDEIHEASVSSDNQRKGFSYQILTFHRSLNEKAYVSENLNATILTPMSDR